MPLLRVIAGPDMGASAEVRDAPVTIGRGPECGLALTDEQVSVIHALVEPFNGRFRVRDLESLDGTTLNRQKVLEHQLMFGDIITVGATCILFGTGTEVDDTETVGSAEMPMPGDADTSA